MGGGKVILEVAMVAKVEFGWVTTNIYFSCVCVLVAVVVVVVYVLEAFYDATGRSLLVLYCWFL